METIMMIVQILIGLGIITGAIVFIVRWCFNVDRRLIITEQKLITIDQKIDNLGQKLEQKINDLPQKIKSEIFDNLISPNIDRIVTENNPLTAEEIQLRNRLLRKLQSHTIAEDEAIKLRDMLEIESEEAKEKAKWDLIFSIGIVLAAIALALEIFKNKK